MTRVEKYSKYRREIANMKIDSFSQKREALEQIERIRNTNTASVYNYDELLEVHEIYDTEEKTKVRRSIRISKYKLRYISIAILIIAIIIIAIIIVGIKTWGN